MQYCFRLVLGVAAGILSLFVTKIFQSGKNLGQIADIHLGEVQMNGPDLLVDSIYIMNVGLEENQQIIAQKGLGLIVKPKTMNSKVTIANLGQRQAMLHNLSTILGVYRDSGEPALIPLAKLDLTNGTLAVFTLPQRRMPKKQLRC